MTDVEPNGIDRYSDFCSWLSQLQSLNNDDEVDSKGTAARLVDILTCSSPKRQRALSYESLLSQFNTNVQQCCANVLPNAPRFLLSPQA